MNQDFQREGTSVELLQRHDIFLTSVSPPTLTYCDNPPTVRRENPWNVWFCRNCCCPFFRTNSNKKSEKLIGKTSFRTFWPKRRQIFDTGVSNGIVLACPLFEASVCLSKCSLHKYKLTSSLVWRIPYYLYDETSCMTF